MDDGAKDSLVDHVQQSELFLAVAAVFQQHAGNAGLFADVNQLPAFVYAGCAANFHGNALACAHGLNAQRDMGFPTSHDDDSVNILAVDALGGIGGTEGNVALGFFNDLL